LPRIAWLLILAGLAQQAGGEGLVPNRLGVVYNRNDPASIRIARYYAAERGVPAGNLVGLSVPVRAVIDRAELRALRLELFDQLPPNVQSLLLVWSRPYAVECMSVTTAIAAGYQAGFCEPGCGRTTLSPLFDGDGWLPADTAGWFPAMLLPIQNEMLARAVIERGVRADWLRYGATASYGTVSEPCNHPGKFPSPSVFLNHYLHGETLLEAYWKSVAMPGQGLFIGEPLARPYPSSP
jgi:hypothetical protein